MGAKPQPCSNQIRAINDRVIMRLQCTLNKNSSTNTVVFGIIIDSWWRSFYKDSIS